MRAPPPLSARHSAEQIKRRTNAVDELWSLNPPWPYYNTTQIITTYRPMISRVVFRLGLNNDGRKKFEPRVETQYFAGFVWLEFLTPKLRYQTEGLVRIITYCYIDNTGRLGTMPIIIVIVRTDVFPVCVGQWKIAALND